MRARVRVRVKDAVQSTCPGGTQGVDGDGACHKSKTLSKPDLIFAVFFVLAPTQRARADLLGPCMGVGAVCVCVVCSVCGG